MNLKRLMLISLIPLIVTCFGCASVKEAAKEVGIAAAEGAYKGATAAAEKALTEQVQQDPNLTVEEKDEVLEKIKAADGIGGLLVAGILYARYRLKKKALGIIVKSVDSLPSEVSEQVKAAVTAHGGETVKAQITAAKG